MIDTEKESPTITGQKLTDSIGIDANPSITFGHICM